MERQQIVTNLPNEPYHNGDIYRQYLSSSQLKAYAKSPKLAKFLIDNPSEQTESMRFGTLFHDLMANIADRDGDYPGGLNAWTQNTAVFTPPVNPKTGLPYGTSTKAYTEAFSAFSTANADRNIVTKDEILEVSTMADSLLHKCGSTSAQVLKLLKWGQPELSFFFITDEGIKLKCRPDLLTRSKIIDWKTTALDDLTEESINRAILRYGYHISAAMYQYIVHEVTGEWKSFYLVFVQKSAPYDCVMVDMRYYGYQYEEETGIAIPGVGAMEFKRLLDLHARCTKNNEWPGAETFINGDKYKIMEIQPPRYYANKWLESDEY